MAEDVQTGASLDRRGHGSCVEGVTDSESWFQVSVRHARLCPLGDEVENSGSSSLTTSACCGWDSNERLKRLVNRETLSKRGIDKVEEISVGISSVEVHELGSVHDGATTDGEKGVGLVRASPCNSFLDAVMMALC